MKYLFRDSLGQWCAVDQAGITTGKQIIVGEVEQLTFNRAINFARDFSAQADDADAVGDDESEERLAGWAEQLEIWAAKQMPAPGRARQAIITIRRAVIHDDTVPTFSEMVGHSKAAINGGVR